MIPGTSWGGIDFGLSRHPYVPLVRWLRRHGLCPCGDRQDEHYSEMPHHSFLLTLADHRQLRWRAPISSIGAESTMGIEPPPCSCADDEDDLRALREARAEGTDRVSRKPKNAPAGVLIVYCSLSCVTRSLFLCSRTMFKSSSERLPSVSIPRRCSSFLASATS